MYATAGLIPGLVFAVVVLPVYGCYWKHRVDKQRVAMGFKTSRTAVGIPVTPNAGAQVAVVVATSVPMEPTSQLGAN